MKDLMQLKTTEVINWLVEEQAEKRGISKTLAKQLILNAITYNVVSSEIDSQIDFLLGEEF